MVRVIASIFLLSPVALSPGVQADSAEHQLTSHRPARREFSHPTLKSSYVTGGLNASCVTTATPNSLSGKRSTTRIASPGKLKVNEILDRFLRGQAELSALLNNYTYHLALDVKEKWNAGHLAGRHSQEWDVVFDDRGRRFAHESAPAFDNLSGLPLQVSDSRGVVDELAPLSFDSGARSKFRFTYLEHAQIDGTPAFKFRVVPVEADKRNPQFLGVIWIDDQSLALVRAKGAILPVASGFSEHVPLHFVEYRAQLDGKHWFPVLEVGEVSSPGMTFHETVKFSNYQRFGSRVRLSFAE